MRREIEHALAEDVGRGDLTAAAVVPAGARARARIEQRAPEVLSGRGGRGGVPRRSRSPAEPGRAGRLRR